MSIGEGNSKKDGCGLEIGVGHEIREHTIRHGHSICV